MYITPTLSIAEHASADDRALPGADAETITSRLTNLDTHAKRYGRYGHLRIKHQSATCYDSRFN